MKGRENGCVETDRKKLTKLQETPVSQTIVFFHFPKEKVWVWLNHHPQGPVSKSWYNVNFKLVNPKMMEIVGFPFQKERLFKLSISHFRHCGFIVSSDIYTLSFFITL